MGYDIYDARQTELDNSLTIDAVCGDKYVILLIFYYHSATFELSIISLEILREPDFIDLSSGWFGPDQ